MREQRIRFVKRVLVPSFCFVILLLCSSTFVCAQWSSVSPPSVSTNWALYGVYFTSADEGWAVGGDVAHARAVLLHYSGGTWSSVLPPSTNGSPFAVHFTSANEGWAVGDGGLLLHYSGGTWSPVSPPPGTEYSTLFGVHFTSAGEGWAVGADNKPSPGGLLLHYSGGTWSSVSLSLMSTNWWLERVHFTSANEGWAVGRDKANQRGILLYCSGGLWSSVSPPPVSANWELRGIHFTSSDEGWAVGFDRTNNRGALLHYSGGTWSSVLPPSHTPQWWLNTAHFTSADEGWAVGGDLNTNATNGVGVLLRYSGGAWSTVSLPSVSTNWVLADVNFTSSGEGWAVGIDSTNKTGVLLHYLVPATVWAGPLSISTKFNSVQKDPNGDMKPQSFTNTYSGILELYVRGNDLVTQGGCYMSFSGDDGTTFCIQQIASASTSVQKSKTDTLYLAGTGTSNVKIEGLLHNGLVYLNAKGTLKKDSSGEVTAIAITGQLGGGEDLNNVFSGSVKVTLTIK